VLPASTFSSRVSTLNETPASWLLSVQPCLYL
jgi:hypothetical protein